MPTEADSRGAIDVADTDMPALAVEATEMLPAEDPRIAVGLNALTLYRTAAAVGHAERPEIFAVVCLSMLLDASV